MVGRKVAEVGGAELVYAGEARPWDDWGLLLLYGVGSKVSAEDSASFNEWKRASVVDTPLFVRDLCVCE
jgi:hypothetical protein